jgi:hypothetical protein
VELTHELLNYYRSVAPASQAAFIESQVKHFVGPEVAECLGLKTNSLLDRVTGIMNATEAFRNLFSLHLNSYHQMMEKHRMLSRNIL